MTGLPRLELRAKKMIPGDWTVHLPGKVSQNSIIGMIRLAGQYAFEPEQYLRFRLIFANAGYAELSQAENHACGDASPLLLLHGIDDRIAFPLHSQLLQERINEEDGRGKKLELEGVGRHPVI